MILDLVYLLTLAYFAPLLLSTLRVNMEPVNLGYSTKNIPIAQPKDYLKCLLQKTESFLRRVRWKAYHFLKPTQPEAAKETFGFNTTKCPPPIKELETFERKLLSIIENAKLKNRNSELQNDLSQDLRKTETDEKLLDLQLSTHR